MPEWISLVTSERPVPAGRRAVRSENDPGSPTTADKTQWSAQSVGRVKPLIFLLCLYPVCRWAWLALGGDGLGANPPEFLIRSSGLWSLVLLWVTLCVSPARRLLGQPALLRLRRMLGLFSFFYTVLHVLGWAYWERGGSLTEMWLDITQRTFVWVGVLAVLPMLLLALTSTRGWMRRLGGRWQRLHYSIYGIACLSVWHFWLVRSGKADYLEPNLYVLALIVLLLVRYWWRRFGK